jgi:integrase/recombinase XerD
VTAEPAAVLSRDAEEYLSWLTVEKGRAVNTVAAYRRDLQAYEGWLATRGLALAAVTEPDVEDYIGHLRETGRRPASVARALSAVRNLHRFLVDEGTAATDPTGEVARPRIPQGLPKALTEDEVAALLDAVAGSDPVARRDRALLELLYGTGVRISEAVGLSLGDVDLESHTAIVLGKGSKERIVPIGRLARQALGAWLAPAGRGSMVPERWRRRSDADAVFLNSRGGRLTRQGAWGIVHHYGDRVGLGERLTPHVLRHSCATHMLDHGADIRVVQELLGHASIATTQLYTKVSTQRLRSVYEAAHPRARRRPAGGPAAETAPEADVAGSVALYGK